MRNSCLSDVLEAVVFVAVWRATRRLWERLWA